MGCDIHLYTEQLVKIGDTKKWCCCDYFMFNPYYGEEPFEDEYELISIYDERNYNAFATLANVRNYGYIEPMDEPRGLPEDVSDTIKKISDGWGEDGHSHSWFTARELFVYRNKHQFQTHSGFVEGDQLKNFDERGIFPTSWCQMTSNKNARWREWTKPGSDLDHLVEAVKRHMKEVFNIWDFYDKEKQEEMLWKHADEFRVVFFFDN